MIPGITWGDDFAGIVRYLTENRDHEVLDLHGVTAIELAADEMSALASLNSRAKNKLLHLSLSAAHEDGSLDAGEWVHCVETATSALCLDGHMRVIVRHRDKTHDHVHAFICTISPATCLTPPKQWFLQKGSGVNDIGPHALTDEQVLSTAPARRAKRTYDFRALARLMDVCRKLERELKLRQLRSPRDAGRARELGGVKGATPGQQKRAERTGSIPLADRADEIRRALDAKDWPSKERSLQAIGILIELVQRETKRGVELRGVVLADITDRGNRIRASALDQPNLKFGFRRMEERHEPGAERIEEWWPKRPIPYPAGAKDLSSNTSELRQEFHRLRLAHQIAEREKADRRKRLRREHSLIRTSKSRSLMLRRKEAASQLAPSERRAFYKVFSMGTAGPIKASLLADQAQELRTLARSRMMTWSEFIAAHTPISAIPALPRAIRRAGAGQAGAVRGRGSDGQQVQRNKVALEPAVNTEISLTAAVDHKVKRVEGPRAETFNRTEHELFQHRLAAFEEARKRAQDEEWSRGPELGIS